MAKTKNGYASLSRSRPSTVSAARSGKARSAATMAARAASVGTMLSTRGFRPGYGRGPSRTSVEKKYIDTAVSNYVVNTTGSVTLLNGVATGDDATDRTGRKIQCESVQIRGFVYPEDDNTTAQMGRVMLVWDKQSNGGSAPAITDILTAATGTAFNNLNNRERFVIIRDHKFVFGPVSDTATQAIAGTYSGSPWAVDDFVRLGPQYQTTFGGTTAAIGSITTGSLLLVTVGDNASGVAALARIRARVRFTDA